MNAEDEFSKLVALCQKLGSPEDQAKRMAGQLIKRADQWVEERGMDRVEAMQRLLELVVSGRQGLTPPGFESEKRSRSGEGEEF
ncbi:MAG: hypothetical protein OSB19_06030 [Opitutaceae bacterium]|nr:hypothetical protein [Opitutaceae bacterium]